MKKLFSLLALAPLWLSAQVPQIGSSVQLKDTRTSTNTALAWLDTNKPTRTSGAVDPSATCAAGDVYIQTTTRHLWACFGATSTDWLDIGFVGGSASFAGLVGDPTDNTSLGAALNAKADLSALTAHTGNVSNPHSTTKTQVGLANVTNALQLQVSLNLSDLNNLITARSNLGLGGSATLNVGTATGTVAAGDHLHTSTYAALVHGHAASDITSGLLGIARIAGSGTCDSTTVLYGDQVCRTPPGSSGGEANTVSNQGSSGVGIFKSKLGVDLGFYKLAAASTKISIVLSGTDHIDFDVAEANIVHQNISGAGTNTHAQIDTHLAATNNPHGTTASQVSAPALTVMTTLGDLPYRDGSTWVRLAGNTASSKRLLCQTGTGTISAAPTWCALVAGDIPTLNQNTTGSAASLSASSALPNGTTATTQTQADNSTKVASTAYVDTGLATRASTTHATSHQNGGSDEVATATAAANAIPKAGAGGTLAAGWIPTLNQSTTGTAANLSGTPALPNGTTGTTQSQADNSTKLSTTAYVDTLGATKAPLASPTFTGTPAAPTATAGTSTTQLATTAFVAALGALKQSTSEKDSNGGYVGRDSSGNSTITGTMTAGNFQGDTTKNAADYYQGVTSGGIAWSVANVAGTAVTLLWPTDSSTATSGTVLSIGGTVTCPTSLPSYAPATCRSTSWAAGGSGSANPASVVTVTFSATPTFSCPSATAGTVTTFTLSTALTANVSSSTLATCTSGQTLHFVFTQDVTGGRSVAMPSGFDAAPVSPTASKTTTLTYTWDGTNGHLVNSSTDDPSVLFLSERAAPGTPASTKAYCWPDSTNHVWSCKANNSSTVSNTVVPATATTGQFVTAISAGGVISKAAISATDLPPAPYPTPGTSVTLVAPASYYECSNTCTVTLPVPATGYQFCVMNAAGNTGAITLAALGSSAMYEKTDHSAYGTAGTGTTVSTAGSYSQICVIGRDSTHYRVASSTGTWTVN